MQKNDPNIDIKRDKERELRSQTNHRSGRPLTSRDLADLLNTPPPPPPPNLRRRFSFADVYPTLDYGHADPGVITPGADNPVTLNPGAPNEIDVYPATPNLADLGRYGTRYRVYVNGTQLDPGDLRARVERHGQGVYCLNCGSNHVATATGYDTLRIDCGRCRAVTVVSP